MTVLLHTFSCWVAQLNSKTRESTFNGVFDVPPCPLPDCISETVPSNQKAPAQSFLACVKARAGTSWGNRTCVQRGVSVGRGGRIARRCPLLSPVEVLVLHPSDLVSQKLMYT